MALYYLPMVQVPVVRSFTDAAVLQNAVSSLMYDSAMLELTKVSVVIAVIFLLWSANIWIYAIKYSRNISMKHAAITVMLPIIVYIIYVLFMTFAGFSALGGFK
jgi:hypothetical protein